MLRVFFKRSKFPIWAISSTHKDSEIMARILRGWGWNLIRGSSTRGWRNVLINMKTLLQKPNTVIALTNDGPKGPPLVAKAGSVSLAIKTNSHIISISCASSAYWTLPTWDRTRIPKPFSTVFVRFGSPLDYSNLRGDVSLLVTHYLNDEIKKVDSLSKK